MDKTLCEIRSKMKRKGVSDVAIRSFERAYSVMQKENSGYVAEKELTPAKGVIDYESLPKSTNFDPELVNQSVVIKLNGGLGTSMVLEKVKSLLEVRSGVTFLDLMARQILSLRKSTGGQVKFLLMNSQATSEDTLSYLQSAAPEMGEASEMELLQSWAPKLKRDDWSPVEWPANPEHEWCPPGHADVYPSLLASGLLDQLLNDGVKYAFISNSDNLGAVLDPALLTHLAKSGAPFVMEVTQRTDSDRKGGHLALRNSDQRLILREVAQCPEEDLAQFQDIEKHQYFNTNNIWVNLEALKEVMDANDGVLPLPVICNSKTVDPRDPSSAPVYQLEQAMGTAIECFEGAQAINVPRSRFAPVKTTADLLALRSDAYTLNEEGHIRLAKSRDGIPPVIKLSNEYKFIDSLNGLGVPSLLEAEEMALEGLVHFPEGVKIIGNVSFENMSDQRAEVPVKSFQDEVWSAS